MCFRSFSFITYDLGCLVLLFRGLACLFKRFWWSQAYFQSFLFCVSDCVCLSLCVGVSDCVFVYVFLFRHSRAYRSTYRILLRIHYMQLLNSSYIWAACFLASVFDIYNKWLFCPALKEIQVPGQQIWFYVYSLVQ